MRSDALLYLSAGEDRETGEWICAGLAEEGYIVTIQDDDFQAGSNLLHEIGKPLKESRHVIAVCSKRYFQKPFALQELYAASTIRLDCSRTSFPRHALVDGSAPDRSSLDSQQNRGAHHRSSDQRPVTEAGAIAFAPFLLFDSAPSRHTHVGASDARHQSYTQTISKHPANWQAGNSLGRRMQGASILALRQRIGDRMIKVMPAL